MSRASVLNLDPSRYVRHPLHGEGAAWVEKNCYVDVWIEAIHALGLDPVAMLPFTLAVDFVGDQWTFFKPPHEDLRALYGVDVQELNVWRPLVEHAAFHVGEGRLVFTEADAFHLPDTQGTDYRTQHTKTTIVIETIDVEARKLGYFHNASYHALEGEDFVRTFRLDAPPDAPPDRAFMPFFAELVRVDRVTRLDRAALVGVSRALLRRHLAHRPETNPFSRYKARFGHDVDLLKGEGEARLARYHAYAFATIRQAGAAFELASSYLRWTEDAALAPAAVACGAIAETAKGLILKTARAVSTRRAVDFAPMLDAMEASWQTAIDALVAAEER